MSIISSSIERHTVPTNIELFDEIENGFGILKIKTAKAPLTRIPCFLLFTIDTTGSMDEPTSESRGSLSKLFYVKATFKNMLRYLSSLSESEIYIQVNQFDSDVNTIIHPIRVSADNCADLIQVIQNLEANGLTALDKPLIEAEKNISAYKCAHPDHTAVHIYMTDGTATSGEQNTETLAAMVNDSYVNLFIGFGGNHNADFMRKCSAKKQASYLFIDNAEDTALFYGEALHQILYPGLIDVQITMTDALIYNWKTNEWVKTIHEDVIIGDCEKIYHVRHMPEEENRIENVIHHPDLMKAFIHGVDRTAGNDDLNEEVDELPLLMDNNTGNCEQIDLIQYLFRQKVLESLYSATSYTNLSRSNKRIYRETLEKLFRFMRRTMRERDLGSDPLMLRLCDDVKVTHSTLNSSVGMMYSMARQSSQGRQQLFTPIRRNDEERRRSFTFPTMPELRDRTLSDASTVVPDGFVPEDELNQYNAEEREDFCYNTPGILDTVRYLSQP